ncbi:MAG TPA: hypothetical protein EYN73_08655, partial [Chromatiaceae bacterium]|nr:hypothetical protein [Chromatiaceae bacterium]
MSDNHSMKPIAGALGAALVCSLGGIQVAQADTNPFGMTDLSAGYLQLAEGKCGEGKCGGEKAKKAMEGKCGEGKCGGDKAKKSMEGKCGEGKCGGDKAKKSMEG